MVSDFRAINNLIKLLFLSVFLLTDVCVLADSKLIPIPKGAINSTVANNGLAQTKSADGARLFSPKIVGGTNASRGEFPEFVQLYIEGAVIGLDPAFLYPWCGGSLISANKVLTAAHCTSGLGLRDFYALPNFYTYNDNITFADLIPISSKVEHPNYQQQTAFDYDVSIITLSQSFGANTAKIFSGRDPLVDFNATLIGTGVLSEGGLEPTTLQKVTVPIVSNAVCKRSYGDSAITDRMICAGLQTGTKDSCNGDSGGPLWVEYDGQKTQAGIVSWGNGCARPNFYGVNTRVSAVTEFILRHAPDTKIVEQKPAILLPVLNLLLLDGPNDVPPPPVDPRPHCRYSSPDQCPADGEMDYLYFYSDHGDFIGEGRTSLIRKADTYFHNLAPLGSQNTIYFSHAIQRDNSTESWDLYLSAQNNDLLTVGKYLNVEAFGSTSANVLDFFGDGRGCSTVTGEFEIFEIEYSPAREVVKLAVNFEQHCEGSLPALYGYLRYNSDKPMLP